MVSPKALTAAMTVVVADFPEVTHWGLLPAFARIFGGLWSSEIPVSSTFQIRIKKYVDFYYNFKTTQRKSIKFCTRIKQLNVTRIIGFTLMYYTCV